MFLYKAVAGNLCALKAEYTMANLFTGFMLKSYITAGTLLCYLKGIKPLQGLDINTFSPNK